MWDQIFSVVRIIAMVYVGLLVLLAGCQRNMLYQPSKIPPGTDLAQWGQRVSLEPWHNTAGEFIGWRDLRADPNETDALLVVHGNAGYAAHRDYFRDGFGNYFRVHILEYPGFGARDGRPSEKTFLEAGNDALTQLSNEGAGRVFLLGESIGSGVAAGLAGSRPDDVAGIFMLTPFNNLAAVAQSHYPIFPVRLLLRDRYKSDEHLTNYEGPMAVLLAEKDEVIPVRFGQALYDGYEGPKKLWIQKGRSHNTLDLMPDRAWWGEVAAFLKDEAKPSR